MRPVKLGNSLEKTPPQDTLPRLFAGSWIHHNYAIWIGHDEDNTAWDALHKTREHLLRRSQESGVRGQGSGVSYQGSGAAVRAMTPDSCPLTPDSRLLTRVQRAW